ncbi:unnamed protein product [Xylocopa violacea]|uniref:Uncharacterized protein n=1 Tax=Xylocopa violacea TaxID=135666 RepID=A0ABP1NW39_XYLVO
MIRVLISLLLASLTIVSVLPRVMSYAKVSRNGQEETEPKIDSSPWIVSNGTPSEGRSIKNIAITVSPVYISHKIPSLKNGEAVNYSPAGRYTTLDHEMIAKLSSKKQIQDRYHPAPLLFKNKQPSGDKKENSNSDSRPSNPPTGPSSSSMFEFSKPPFSESYEYKPPDYMNSKPITKPPDYLSDKPISKPLSMDDYTDSEISDKPPDSYKPDSYFASHDQQPDYPDYKPDMSYNNDAAPKPMEYSGHLDHPPYGSDDDSYGHHHDFHHEVIYDEIPEYHDHTEQPEMNDQRLDKRPYSYYYIGKKLWYLPLYFSIYFVIYIAALVLKSIARHKITFPAHLADAVGHGRSYNEQSWWDYAGQILQGIESFAEKYGKIS